MSLRIGFDAKRLFLNREGLGSYARTLVRTLHTSYPEHSYHLFTPGTGDFAEANYFLNHSSFKIHLPRKMEPGVYWRRYGITRLLDRLKLDIYIGLSNELPAGIKHQKCRSIVTIHDLFYLDFPRQFGNAQRFLTGLKTRHAVRSADRVVAISKYTRQRLLDTFDLPPGLVHLIYQSVEPGSGIQPMPGNLPGEYFLYVGSLTQRKNPFYIINALRQISPAERPNVVMVGKGKLEKDLHAACRKYGLENNMYFCGTVNSSELGTLYRHASGLIFPSLCEGFGRPVLEALHFGIPVYHGNHSALNEVAGQYGTVIDLMKPSSLAEALQEKQGKTRLDKLSSHLAKFDSKKQARAWMDLISEIVQ